MPLKDHQKIFPSTVRQLCQTKRLGRVFHSTIFTGNHLPRLERFVNSWNQVCVCINPTELGDACGDCRTCNQIQNSRYPYLFKVEPTSKSRHILVEQVRDLERSLQLTSEGQPKIGLILEADRLVDQAQNAFLKFLEEPPLETLIVLVTLNVNALLPTIRSRCQIIRLEGVGKEYCFSGLDQVVQALISMNLGKGAMVAVSAAQLILEVLTALQKDAEKDIEDKFRNKQTKYLEEDNGLKKKIESVKTARTSSVYLGHRDQLLGSIYTWYAQEFMRASGIPIPLLPHPEFYNKAPSEVKENGPATNKALRNLQLSDHLIKNSMLNVSEPLMIQDFCHKICAKSVLSC